MIFTPKTEEEIQMDGLIPEGKYEYRVLSAEELIGQSSHNPYIKLVLQVYDNEGQVRQVFTNLAMAKLLKHFCDVNGLSEQYKSGNLPAELLLNKSGGCVMLGIEGEKPRKDGNGVYKAKNIVTDYVPEPRGSMMKPLPEVKNEFHNDDIPF